MSVIPSARVVNIFFAVVLSFIAGFAANANADGIKKVAGTVCKKCFAPNCEDGGCCTKKAKNSACGCAKCDGACGGGKGSCSCDPLTCLDVSGCNAWCPGK